MNNSRQHTVNLAKRLALRDVKAMYRQSVLGVFWAFLLPLVNTFTWVFLNASGIVSVAESDIPYPLYVFVGTMLWQILTEAITIPIQVSVSAKPLFTKIYFPHEAVILSGFFQVLFNAFIKMLILTVAILFLGVTPSFYLIFAPLCVVLLILLGMAFGVLLAPLGILYSDISKGIPLLMQLLMYLTPVVFFIPESGWGRFIYQWNPITPLLNNSRNLIVGMDVQDMTYFTVITCSVLLVFIMSIRFYRKAIPILIERMSS